MTELVKQARVQAQVVYLATEKMVADQVSACLTACADRIEVLEKENAQLRAALTDMYAGWRYIRIVHGDLSGVGWERCDASAKAALKDPYHD